MSFSAPWDESKPAGSRNLNLGDDDIREFKTGVRERCDVDGYFPSTDDANTGYHRKLTFIEQASDPAQVADALVLYSKLTGSYAELYSRHENAALQQLTLNGKLWISALSMASLAQGDILYFDGSVMTRLGAGATGLFLKTLGAGANPLWADPGVLPAASQAQMEAAASAAVSVTPLVAQYHPGMAKAWVIFNGTGTPSILASYNVASITDNATGDWTVNLTTAMSSVNFGVIVSAHRNGGSCIGRLAATAGTPLTASSARVIATDDGGGLVDADIVCVAFYGDQ